MIYKHEIDFGGGFQAVTAPRNEDAIRIDFVFTSASPTATIQSINLEWAGEVAKKMNNYFNAGLYGGKGITEALPYRISACNGLLQLDLMLDLTNASTLWECDMVKCPVKQSGKIEWLEKASEGLSFWYLRATNQITTADYKKTPYQLSTLPNNTNVMLLTIAEFMVIWQIYQLVQMIKEFIAYLSGLFAMTPLSLGAVAIALASAVGLGIYAYTLINLFIQLLVDIKKNIIQAKKYKYCMREKDLFTKAATALGLQFSSTIYQTGSLYENATWMPAKIVMPKKNQSVLSAFDRPEDESKSVHSYGYFDGTLNDFFEAMILKYDGQITIKNNTLFFENRNNLNVQSFFKMPNTGEIANTFNLPAPFRTNASELSPHYWVRFPTDDSDPNTKHRYRGTSYRVQLIPVNAGANIKYQGWGQKQEIIMPCALGKRKDYLTETEVVFNEIIKAINQLINAVATPINFLINLINKIIKLFGGNGIPTIPINPIPSLDQRIGWLEVAADSWQMPKTFIGTNVNGDWVLTSTSEDVMSAKGIMNNFYGLNLATRGNQWRIYENNKFRLCCEDAFRIKDSNLFQTFDNKIGKFVRLEWWLKGEIAENVEYRVNEKWTNALKEVILEDETQ